MKRTLIVGAIVGTTLAGVAGTALAESSNNSDSRDKACEVAQHVPPFCDVLPELPGDDGTGINNG